MNDSIFKNLCIRNIQLKNVRLLEIGLKDLSNQFTMSNSSNQQTINKSIKHHQVNQTCTISLFRICRVIYAFIIGCEAFGNILF